MADEVMYLAESSSVGHDPCLLTDVVEVTNHKRICHLDIMQMLYRVCRHDPNCFGTRRVEVNIVRIDLYNLGLFRRTTAKVSCGAPKLNY